MAKIVVTGAFGFVGFALVDRLVETHDVIALSRSARSHAKAKCVQVDYRSVSEMTHALEGADVLVHLAQDADRQSASQRDANLAEIAICSAMQGAGVNRMIFASSIYARLFEVGRDSPYGQVKAKSEKAFFSAPFQSIFLRFPPIYGPNCRGGFGTLVQAISKGVPLPLGLAHSPRSYISRENAVTLIDRLVAMDAIGWSVLNRRAYEPSDERTLSTADLARAIGTALGHSARLVPVPPAILRALGKLLGQSAVVSGVFDPLIAETNVELSKHSGWFPTTHIPDSLEFLAKP
jgi:UDP-glucose 4-epimerase